MTDNKRDLKVAIAGLGQVGTTFLRKFADKIGTGVEIVAVAEINKDAPGIELAKDKGINVVNDPKELVAMGEEIDIIFDLTGNEDAKKAMRSDLARSGNQYTALVPEVVAYLLWNLMDGSTVLPEKHGKIGY
ncbi:MAG: hypothetical protein KAT46_05050 [Deltaproteobacteria bacterium]|nr:hypothetical protein [Deltaproteobacteria bacterium]